MEYGEYLAHRAVPPEGESGGKERKTWSDLSPAEKERFLNTLNALKQETINVYGYGLEQVQLRIKRLLESVKNAPFDFQKEVATKKMGERIQRSAGRRFDRVKRKNKVDRRRRAAKKISNLVKSKIQDGLGLSK